MISLSPGLTSKTERDCALGAVASGPKKMPAECCCTRLASFISGRFIQDTLSCHGIDFGASGADDLIGGAEDLLGALFRYRFRVKTTPTADPILNVTSAKVCPLKSQRFATQKRHGFRFDLAQTTRRRLSIGEICLGCMT